MNIHASIIFFMICSALDEIVTFNNLSKGGVEFNPRVAWLISINPLLYTLVDIGLILLFFKVDKWLGIRDLWIIWASAGIGRLVCFGWSMV